MCTVYALHRFIGEETTAENGGCSELTDDPTWIVDPIDGTSNFVHRCVLGCGYLPRAKLVERPSFVINWQQVRSCIQFSITVHCNFALCA